MVFQNYFAEMPTPEEKLSELKTKRAELETRFNQAAKTIDEVKQEYSEVSGGIKALEALNEED